MEQNKEPRKVYVQNGDKVDVYVLETPAETISLADYARIRAGELRGIIAKRQAEIDKEMQPIYNELDYYEKIIAEDDKAKALEQEPGDIVAAPAEETKQKKRK